MSYLWGAIGIFSRDTVERRKVVCVRDYQPGDTYRCIWQKSTDVELWFVIYRIVHAVFMLILLVISFFHMFIRCPTTTVNQDQYICLGPESQINPAWPYYLTRWGLMLNFFQAMMGLTFAVKAYLRPSRITPARNENRGEQSETAEDEDITATVHKSGNSHNPSLGIEDTVQHAGSVDAVRNGSRKQQEHSFLSVTGTYWGVHSVSTVLTVLIDIVYWGVLHRFNEDITARYVYYLAEHGINFFLMAADSFIVAFPVLMIHCVHLTIVGGAYTVVSILYYLAGGLDWKHVNRYLYSFLNWEKPLPTFFNLLGLYSFSFAALFLLMLLDFVKHRYFRPRPPVNSQSDSRMQNEIV